MAVAATLTAGLHVAQESTAPPPALLPAQQPLARPSDGCYRYVRDSTFVRDECVFRVLMTGRDYEALDLAGLERRLWASAGPLLRPLGFDTLQVVAVWPRDRLKEHFAALDAHYVSAPAASVSDATERLDSISEWDYEPVAIYERYRSVVLTRADSPVRSFADLRDTVAVVDESSSSGYRIPIGYLHSVGIYPPTISLRGRHADVVEAVLRGDVSAGATHDGWRTYLPAGSENALRAMPIPIAIPGQAWVLRRDLSAGPQITARLVAAAAAWSAQVNRDEDYWTRLETATPDDLDAYDAFRHIERVLRDSTAVAARPAPAR